MDGVSDEGCCVEMFDGVGMGGGKSGALGVEVGVHRGSRLGPLWFVNVLGLRLGNSGRACLWNFFWRMVLF